MPVSLHDYGVVNKPKAIRDAREERNDRRKDASAGQVGTRVRRERPSVDYNGDGRARWE